ncbi:MAG: putative porin, partial [Chthoniobacterales bacterium]|nr:putative porin [Chthoniobacterales bacterium]
MNRLFFQTILAALVLAGAWCRAAQPAGPLEAAPPAEVAIPSAPVVPAAESPALEEGPSAEILEATAVEIAAVPIETSPLAPAVEPELPTWTVEPYAKEDTAPLAATAATAGNNAASAAETPEEPPAAGQNIATTPTGNVVINLINKLVERGVLTAGDARGMITQAQAEAETQKVQNESDMFAIAQIAAVQTMTDQALA